MATEVEIGAWFDDRYQVVGKLGAGGFADVYEATDPESGESVAIKVLKPGDDQTTLRRFEREAEALKRLPGEGFSRLLHHGHTADGVPYLVFELVRGEDLSELLERRGKLGPDETVAVLRQLASVLGAAHDVGVLHRDLKPENVRVTDERTLRVKLLDFGIARLTDEGSPSLTATGEVIGTLHYMSPEQLTGRALSPSSDIYNLGVVAFELLLGPDSMHGHTLLDQIDRMHGGYQFPEADIGGHGEGLLQILRRMTVRDPAARYQSARAVLVALDSLDRDPTIGAAHVAAPPPPKPDVREVRSKRPYFVAAVVAGIVAVIAIAVFLSSSADEPETGPVTRREPPVGARFAPWAREASPKIAADAGSQAPPIATAAGSPQGPCTKAPWFTGRGELFGEPAYVPQVQIGERVPLVIMLHGNGMRAGQWLAASGFTELADEHHFVVVAPNDGMLKPWEGDDGRDVERLERLQARAQEELCIDNRRVFVVGQEQAGKLTYALACEPWVAGVALNAWSPTKSDVSCDGRSIPKPMMLSLPDRFGWTPPNGGLNCKGKTERLSFDKQEELWRERNGCTDQHKTSRPEAAVCRDWTCAQPLRVCRTRGGGDWPGSPPMRAAPGCEHPSTSFRHAEQMWDFFQSLTPSDDDAGSE